MLYIFTIAQSFGKIYGQMQENREKSIHNAQKPQSLTLPYFVKVTIAILWEYDII